MPRTARIVLPDHPHHVIQRGNRCMPVFFKDDDYRLYKSIFAEEAAKCALECWAYCLMPNHVHMIVVPKHPEDLGRVFKETHRRYTRYINKREGWTGFLWQGRFASFAMNETHATMAVRYTENNPVHAALVKQAEDYRWSSAKAHMGLERDDMVSACYLDEQIDDWRQYLRDGQDERTSQLDEKIISAHLASGDTLI